MMIGSAPIILADDHPLVLRGLVDLFSSERDFQVIGTAADGKAALEMILEKQPEIAVLDLVMPLLSGLDILRELVQVGTTVKVVFLSALITEEQSIQAVGVGAWGILLKESAPETLIECMSSVRVGKRWLPDNLFGIRSSMSQRNPFDGLPDTLTGREWEIVNLVAQGLSNKSIARLLNLTEGTIKIHLHNVYSKLEITNRTTLAAKVISLRRPANFGSAPA
jgi:DNA-binding NarL/FixJ family response regulator